MKARLGLFSSGLNIFELKIASIMPLSGRLKPINGFNLRSSYLGKAILKVIFMALSVN